MGWCKVSRQKLIKFNALLVGSCLILGFCFFSKVPITGAESPVHPAFQDNVFYSCVINSLNAEKVGNKTNRTTSSKVTDDELAKLKNLDCDLRRDDAETLNTIGIERLVSLTDLTISNNDIVMSLINFDLRHQLALESLTLENIDLKVKIDLSKNVKLESLRISLDIRGSGHPYTTPAIILPKGQKLKRIIAYFTNLGLTATEPTIDLSGVTGLESLTIGGVLSSTSLIHNPHLKDFRFVGAVINHAMLDLSHNVDLETFSYKGFGRIVPDFSKNLKLKSVTIYNTHPLSDGGAWWACDLQSQKSPNFTAKYGLLDFSKHQALEELHLDEIVLDGLILSKNSLLKTVDIRSTSFNNLDLSSSSQLTRLVLHCNNLKQIDLPRNGKLREVTIIHNSLSQIDLSNNPNITSLKLSNNQLNDIVITSATQLVGLTLDNNQLTSLDISNNRQMTSLSASNNRLVELKTHKKSAKLFDIDLSNNRLSNIDLNNYPSLKSCNLVGNQLTFLDLSKNVSLGFGSLGLDTEKPITVKVPTETARDTLARKYSNLTIEVVGGNHASEASEVPEGVEYVPEDDVNHINYLDDIVSFMVIFVASYLFRIIIGAITFGVISIRKRKLKKAS